MKVPYKTKYLQTSTDYEINAAINALESFKLFLVNKKEITIRTDCELIVAYSNSQINSDKKPHKRWLLFKEHVYHNGIKVNFEHIKGTKNIAADILSRFTGTNEAGKNIVSECQTKDEVW